MQIREASPHDAAPIAELHTDSWRATYRGVLPDAYLDDRLAADRAAVWVGRFSSPEPGQHILVAEEDARLIGFACAFGAHDLDHGTLLENLHVRSGFKGRGIGLDMMRAVAQWSLSAHPGIGMHLWALEPNIAARGFYERLGGTVSAHGNWASPAGVAVPELRYSWASLEKFSPTRSRPAR